ncbi:MAG: hypothetical protein AB1327_08000 [Bacillota bacterium]
MTRKPKWKPAAWQRNPETLKASKVQYWSNGSMLTAQMTLQEAQRLVKEGKAYVITKQAIGDILNP